MSRGTDPAQADPGQENREVSPPSDRPSPALAGPECNAQCNAIDAVEAALAAALEGARRAGEWGVVAQLAMELKARREARSGDNVVALPQPRRLRK